jgi:hypothetical protein
MLFEGVPSAAAPLVIVFGTSSILLRTFYSVCLSLLKVSIISLLLSKGVLGLHLNKRGRYQLPITSLPPYKLPFLHVHRKSLEVLPDVMMAALLACRRLHIGTRERNKFANVMCDIYRKKIL